LFVFSPITVSKTTKNPRTKKSGFGQNKQNNHGKKKNKINKENLLCVMRFFEQIVNADTFIIDSNYSIECSESN